MNEFEEISARLVEIGRLTRYDRIVLFLEGLPVSLAKVYREVKLDTRNPDTFEREGCFEEAIEAPITHNRTDADFDRLRIKEGREKPQGKETISKILQNPEWKPPTPSNAVGGKHVRTLGRIDSTTIRKVIRNRSP